MKAVMFAIAVLGLTVFFGLSEPTLASNTPVSSDAVSVSRERLVAPTSDQQASRNKNGRKKGVGTAAIAGLIFGAEW